MWPGASSLSALYVVNKILKTMHCLMGNQCRSIKILGVMCSNSLLLHISQYFLHLTERFFPPNCDQLTHGGKTINVLFEGEKTFSLRLNCRGRKAQKNSARYLKANTNFVYCTINAPIQHFHRDENILMQSASVVC